MNGTPTGLNELMIHVFVSYKRCENRLTDSETIEICDYNSLVSHGDYKTSPASFIKMYNSLVGTLF